jgi:hypothetical protein
LERKKTQAPSWTVTVAIEEALEERHPPEKVLNPANIDRLGE